MSPRHVPVKRHLVAPLLLLLSIVVGLQVFEARTPGEVDPEHDLGPLLPPAIEAPPSCSRHGATPGRRTVTVQPLAGRRVTSLEVQACPAAFDGRSVTFVGELVGDLLRRDGGAWVLANDDDYALAVGPLPGHRHHRGTNTGVTVWLPDELVDRVSGLGGPGWRGDVVEIRGVVLRTDPADGGGLTIRARTMRVVAPATAVDAPLDLRQAALALAAVIAAGGLWTARRQATRGRWPDQVR